MNYLIAIAVAVALFIGFSSPYDKYDIDAGITVVTEIGKQKQAIIARHAAALERAEEMLAADTLALKNRARNAGHEAVALAESHRAAALDLKKARIKAAALSALESSKHAAAKATDATIEAGEAAKDAVFSAYEDIASRF